MSPHLTSPFVHYNVSSYGCHSVTRAIGRFFILKLGKFGQIRQTIKSMLPMRIRPKAASRTFRFENLIRRFKIQKIHFGISEFRELKKRLKILKK